MAKSGTLRVKIVGDSKDLQKTVGGAGKTIKKFGAIALGAGAAAAAGGVLLVKHAGRLEATGKKAAAVFEDQLPSVEKWAKANAGAMGLASSELTGLTANFADLLKPMGFTAEQAAGMAMETNDLSGALAEWSGGQKSAAEVSEILAKAMLGEREQLKTLGISITEADVKARLLKKGQEELTGAALEQAKAIATQELIMEKSTDAQTAYADGAGSLQRKQAEVTATIKEFRDKGLKALMPFAHTIAEWAAKTLPKALAGLTTLFRSRVVPAFEALSAWWSQNGPTIIAAAQRLQEKVRQAFDGVVAAVQFVMKHWDKFKVAIGVAVAIMVPHFVALGVAATVSSVKQVAAWVATNVAAAAAAVAHSAHVVFMVARWAFMGVQALLHAAKVAAAWVIALGPVGWVIATVVAVAALIIKNWSKIVGWTKKAWSAVAGAVVAAWRAVVGAIGRAWSWIVSKFQQATGWLKRTWDRTWGAVTRTADRAVSFVRGIPGRILSALSGLASSVASFIAKWHPAAVLYRMIQSGLPRVIGFVRSIPGRIRSSLGNLGRLLRGAGRSLISGLWSGISSMGGWLKDKLTSFVTSRIPGPIARALGISSPSKVAAKLARQVPRGMMVGMEAEGRNLQRAAEKMAMRALPKLGVPTVSGLSSASPVGRPSGGGGGSNQPIVIRNVIELDGRVVYEDVKRRAVSDGRRNVSTGIV